MAGGFLEQLGVTLYIGAGSLSTTTTFNVSQPPAPPPIGIPSGAAILDWRG